uniref:Uncharacterized protein n=1 Tax=Arundo donax TaxID=35708 RepID=A0A0A9DNZ4_ARUDO
MRCPSKARIWTSCGINNHNLSDQVAKTCAHDLY